jgi:hypothetical protein
MAGPDSKHQTNEDRIGVIDLIAHDPKTDEAVLVMNEAEPWDGSEKRLLELQERFNAYVSFLLDGEFAEWDPKLAQKRARIEVRCEHIPDTRALDLLGNIHDQLAHQDIKVEVVVRGRKNRQD